MVPWGESLSAPVRQYPVGVVFGDTVNPRWAHGHFTAYNRLSGRVVAFDAAGVKVLDRGVRPQVAGVLNLLDVAAGPGGVFAASGAVSDAAAVRDHFLAFVRPGQAEVRFVSLPSCTLRSLEFASDGSIWTLGSCAGEDELVRHYSAEGKWIESALPKTLFDSERSLLLWSRLRVGSDGRVAIFIGETRDYVEWFPTEKRMQRYKLPAFAYEFALTESGEAVFSIETTLPSGRKSAQIQRLDRATSELIPVASHVILYGSDGDSLVIGSPADPNRIQWVSIVR